MAKQTKRIQPTIPGDSITEREILLDTTVSQIVNWDKAGDRLVFDYEKLRLLPDEVVQELHHENKTAYIVAKSVNDTVRRHEAERAAGERGPIGSTVEVIAPLGGSATGRLRLKQKDPKFHYCFKRTDEINDCLDEGYQIVNGDDPVKSPGARGPSGTRRISHHGEDELILLKIPESRYQGHLQAVSQISQGAGKRVREESRERMEKEAKDNGVTLPTFDNTREVQGTLAVDTEEGVK
jgi:hypothetical protein